MPVFKCNGKWKIGKNGKCRFDSKAKAENAFKHWVENQAVQEIYLSTPTEESHVAYRFSDGHEETLALMEQRFNEEYVEHEVTFVAYDQEKIE